MADVFRRKYVKPSDEAIKLADDIKAKAEELLDLINSISPEMERSSRSRDKSISITHLEDCVMRATRGVTTPQISSKDNK